MIKVLHIYPKNDNMIASHVSILTEALHQSAEVLAVSGLGEFKAASRKMQPDILHCHGCWHYAVSRAAAIARNHGARIVISPHGQLEPWVIEDKSLNEKIQQRLLSQKRAIGSAYALIAFGRMEQHHLEKLGWNPRIETIRNSLITNSITPAQMAHDTLAVYQKVMDSSVLEQMNLPTLQLLAQLIKAGITGDRRWLPETLATTDTDWRRLLLYAEHENISNYTSYGISTLGIDCPPIDPTAIPSYFPPGYQKPKPLKEVVEAYKGNETDYLVSIIRHIHKQPLLLHLIELHRELMRDNVDDNLLQEALRDKRLYKQASRLMQVLSELTLLDEGFMPLPPTDDKGTRKIRNSINNHLKI